MGTTGSINYSYTPDVGSSWVSKNYSFTTNIRSFACGNTPTSILWVAVSNNNIMYTFNPSDSNPWTSVDESRSYSSVAFGYDTEGAPLWVVTADSSGDDILCMHDPTDPSGWIRTKIFSNAAYGIAYGKLENGTNIWIAVGDDSNGNNIKYSYNPTNINSWTTSYTSIGSQIYGITYGNNSWVAYGITGFVYSTSPPNNLWNPGPNIGEISSFVFGRDNSGNSLWVAATDGGVKCTQELSSPANTWVIANISTSTLAFNQILTPLG